MFTISLSNVYFSYDSMNPILDGVSIAFNDFDRVAIVGDNGSGKTTLLKLLAGDIVPDFLGLQRVRRMNQPLFRA